LRIAAFSIGLAVIAGGALATSAPARAERDVWVSGVGVDTGNCNMAAPCRSFQYAQTKTSDGGAIRVASSGVFEAVTIRKSISIIGDGSVAIVKGIAPCGAAICVAVSSTVTLRGLTIDQTGVPGHGIQVGGGSFQMENCRVVGTGSGKSGIAIQNATIDARYSIVDSTIANNGIGISVTAGLSLVTILRVQIENNEQGIVFDRGNGQIRSTISESVIAGNSMRGISALGGEPQVIDPLGNRPLEVMLDRTLVVNNGDGIVAESKSAMIRIGNSVVTGNNTALKPLKKGIIGSYRTNKIDGNAAGEDPTRNMARQ